MSDLLSAGADANLRMHCNRAHSTRLQEEGKVDNENYQATIVDPARLYAELAFSLVTLQNTVGSVPPHPGMRRVPP